MGLRAGSQPGSGGQGGDSKWAGPGAGTRTERRGRGPKAMRKMARPVGAGNLGGPDLWRQGWVELPQDLGRWATWACSSHAVPEMLSLPEPGAFPGKDACG